jgi:hypothetical protein
METPSNTRRPLPRARQSAVRLCSYVVVKDTGFAPNPFGGYCTLAACTPNHQGIKLGKDDWILGNSSARKGRRLVFAMRISEPPVDFDDYYRDPRFAEKKADASTWQGRCGDNIYFRDAGGQWAQGPAFNHTDDRLFGKDTRYHHVFISDHFFYFGENAPDIPEEYSSLVRTTQGCCWRRHDPNTVGEFIVWIEQYSTGARTVECSGSRLHGLPRDRDAGEGCAAMCGHLVQPAGTGGHASEQLSRHAPRCV